MTARLACAALALVGAGLVPAPTRGQAAAPAAPAVGSAADPSGCPARLTSPPTRRLAGPGVDVAWRAVPDPPPVGKAFGIEFEVCPRQAGAAVDRLRVDAWMPEHRHGMNYRPSVSGQPSQVQRGDGLLFHMPGRWQVVFEFRLAGEPVRLVDDLVVR